MFSLILESFFDTYCVKGILVHHQLKSPSPWTSSCVCVRGDGVGGATSCPGEHEPRCREYGDLTRTWKKNNFKSLYLN